MTDGKHFKYPDREIYCVTKEKEGTKVDILTMRPFPEELELLADYDTKAEAEAFIAGYNCREQEEKGR